MVTGVPSPGEFLVAVYSSSSTGAAPRDRPGTGCSTPRERELFAPMGGRKYADASDNWKRSSVLVFCSAPHHPFLASFALFALAVRRSLPCQASAAGGNPFDLFWRNRGWMGRGGVTTAVFRSGDGRKTSAFYAAAWNLGGRVLALLLRVLRSLFVWGERSEACLAQACDLRN